VSGLLLAGALPHLDWGWLAWFALVPFLRLFPFRSTRAAFGHGMALGAFYLGVMSYWIIVFAGHLIGPALSTLGWALVTAYQAFYLGVWAVGAQWLRTRPSPWAFRLGVPALWAVVEWWRQSGTLALGWGDLAYTQHLALPVLQVTKLTGIWGLAFLIVLVNIALAELAPPAPNSGGEDGPPRPPKRGCQNHGLVFFIPPPPILGEPDRGVLLLLPQNWGPGGLPPLHRRPRRRRAGRGRSDDPQRAPAAHVCGRRAAREHQPERPAGPRLC